MPTTTDKQPAQPPAPSFKTTSVAAREGLANPQGKGLVGFLQDWHYSRPTAVVAKSSGRLLADYFTSLLVLSADFKFKPAFGQTYHLYRGDSAWLLSLISPDEWNRGDKTRGYVGACELHDDATWSLQPSANLGKPGPVSDALADVYDGFITRLQSNAPLESALPVYEAHLPYYQRLFASSLARSLRASLVAGRQTGRAATSWLEALPGDAGRLLIHDAD